MVFNTEHYKLISSYTRQVGVGKMVAVGKIR